MFIPQSSTLVDLVARQYISCGSNQYRDSYGVCRNAGWYYWGRWVLAAIIIVFFIALFVIWSCITNKRRRRAGLQPRYGTGWMAPGHWGQQNHYNNGAPQQPQYSNGGWFGHGGNKHNQPPPPQYTPNPGPVQYNTTGQTFNSNEGYYGHHQNDVPLQQPQGSYYPRAGENVYEPPSGPPPAKN